MLIWHGHNKHIVSMNEAETNLVDIYKKKVCLVYRFTLMCSSTVI